MKQQMERPRKCNKSIGRRRGRPCVEYRRTKSITTNNQYTMSTREKHTTATTTKRTDLQSRMLRCLARAARIDKCWCSIKAASSVTVAATSRPEFRGRSCFQQQHHCVQQHMNLQIVKEKENRNKMYQFKNAKE